MALNEGQNSSSPVVHLEIDLGIGSKSPVKLITSPTSYRRALTRYDIMSIVEGLLDEDCKLQSLAEDFFTESERVVFNNLYREAKRAKLIA